MQRDLSFLEARKTAPNEFQIGVGGIKTSCRKDAERGWGSEREQTKKNGKTLVDKDNEIIHAGACVVNWTKAE